MSINRRNFLKITAGAAGACGVAAAAGKAVGGTGATGGRGAEQAAAPVPGRKDTPIGRLKPMTAGVVPISDA
ncbi:MAG: hypothetical protein ABFD80_11920, partial [Acidobacteriota bacterium]